MLVKRVAFVFNRVLQFPNDSSSKHIEFSFSTVGKKITGEKTIKSGMQKKKKLSSKASGSNTCKDFSGASSCLNQVVKSMTEIMRFPRSGSPGKNDRLVWSWRQHGAVGRLCRCVNMRRHVLCFTSTEELYHLKKNRTNNVIHVRFWQPRNELPVQNRRLAEKLDWWLPSSVQHTYEASWKKKEET